MAASGAVVLWFGDDRAKRKEGEENDERPETRSSVDSSPWLLTGGLGGSGPRASRISRWPKGTHPTLRSINDGDGRG
jgi:hypothetical protein